MPIFEPGRVCVKIAGREAGKYCAVLEVVDEKYVVVEGPEVRRRKTNIVHLEPLNDMVSVANLKEEIAKKFGAKGTKQT